MQASAAPTECSSEKFVIRNRNDLEPISKCSSLKGRVEIIDYEDQLLILNELHRIDGILEVSNSSALVRMEAKNLHTITDSFRMNKLTTLAIISMPNLSTVKLLDWQVLPLLATINFGQLEETESVVISDTSLSGLSGFSGHEMDVFDINNNRFLEFVYSEVHHVRGMLHISANAKGVIIELPELVESQNVSIHNVGDLNMRSLRAVRGAVSLYGNLFLTLDLPGLQKVDGTMSVAQNHALVWANFAQLSEVGGGLQVVNNTDLTAIDFFPNLTMVGGALELMGNIEQNSWPSLKLVKGSVKLLTSNKSFDCDSWSERTIAPVVKGGKVECLVATPEEMTNAIQKSEVSVQSEALAVRWNAWWALVAVGVALLHRIIYP